MVYQPPDFFISPHFHGSVHKEKMPPMSASLQGALVQWLHGAADRRGPETDWGRNVTAEFEGWAVNCWLWCWLGAEGQTCAVASSVQYPLAAKEGAAPSAVHAAGTQTLGLLLFHMSRLFSFSVISSHRPLSPLRPKWPFSLLRLLFFFHSVYPNLCVSLPPIQILLDSDLSCPLLQLQYLIQLWAHTGCSINSTWMNDEYHLEITHSPLLKVWLQPTTVI